MPISNIGPYTGEPGGRIYASMDGIVTAYYGVWQSFESIPDVEDEYFWAYREDAGVFIIELYDETWFTAGGYEDLTGGMEPSHWMPIWKPEPPQMTPLTDDT